MCVKCQQGGGGVADDNMEGNYYSQCLSWTLFQEKRGEAEFCKLCEILGGGFQGLVQQEIKHIEEQRLISMLDNAPSHCARSSTSFLPPKRFKRKRFMD